MVGKTRFEFSTAHRIIFGEGSVREVAGAARGFGSRAMLVTGRRMERSSWLGRELHSLNFAVEGEPTVDLVRQGAAIARDHGADVVIGYGGGSALDAAKAIAAMAA